MKIRQIVKNNLKNSKHGTKSMRTIWEMTMEEVSVQAKKSLGSDTET